MADTCETCRFWRKDRGVWTATGWTGADRDEGHCLIDPMPVPKRASDFCSFHEVDHGF